MSSISKSLFPSAIAGQFEFIEKFKIDAGQYAGKVYEINTLVYESKEMAAIAGNKAAVGNTIFVGITTHDFEGKNYFSPGFNVWD